MDRFGWSVVGGQWWPVPAGPLGVGSWGWWVARWGWATVGRKAIWQVSIDWFGILYKNENLAKSELIFLNNWSGAILYSKQQQNTT